MQYVSALRGGEGDGLKTRSHRRTDLTNVGSVGPRPDDLQDYDISADVAVNRCFSDARVVAQIGCRVHKVQSAGDCRATGSGIRCLGECPRHQKILLVQAGSAARAVKAPLGRSRERRYEESAPFLG